MNPATPLPPVKLSAPATHEFWEIPVLHEDARLLALAKPPRLLTSPDRYDPERPNLMRLLHEAVAAGKPWAAARGLSYVANVHRLDFETSGVLLLAKDKPALVHLAAQFGAGKPHKTYLALVRGSPREDSFQVDLRLKPDPRLPGRMRWGLDGKKSLTEFTVLERFRGASLVACHPHTGRTHQIRVHLRAADHPIFGDDFYGDGVRLFLSKFKRDFRLKPGREERPLTPTLALHAWKLEVDHPDDGHRVAIEAPIPHDLAIALKYLRKYAAKSPGPLAEDSSADLPAGGSPEGSGPGQPD